MGIKKIIIGLCLGIYTFCGCSNEPLQPIRSGEIWPDNNGEHINAHGGGVMYHDGEHTIGSVRINVILPAVPWWE